MSLDIKKTRRETVVTLKKWDSLDNLLFFSWKNH